MLQYMSYEIAIILFIKFLSENHYSYADRNIASYRMQQDSRMFKTRATLFFEWTV